MENQERSHSVFPITVLLLAVGVGSYFLYEQPFVSYRPAQPEPYQRDLTSSEGIDARLWEDPFKAVFTSAQSTECADGLTPGGRRCLAEQFSHELSQLAFEIRRRVGEAGLLLGQKGAPAGPLGEDGAAPFVLLPVMVPGEPYAEQAEKRRRTRHAVVSGLWAAGYVPEVGESIGYVNTYWTPRGEIARRMGRSVRIPFEWFVRDSLRPIAERGRARSVLVLWLDESAFRDDPLRQVDHLLRHLTGFCERVKAAVGPDVGCRVPRHLFEPRLLGPATSGVLRTMVRRAGSENADRPRPLETAVDPTAALVSLAGSYLDEPDQWTYDEKGSLTARRTDALRPAVEDTLHAWHSTPAELRPAKLPSILAPLSRALRIVGEKVPDSDPEWHETVAFFWAREILFEDRLRTSRRRTESAHLAESLTRSLLTTMGIEPPAPGQHRPSGDRVARSTDSPSRVETKIQGTIIDAWKQVQRPHPPSPHFWTDWFQVLEKAIEHALEDHFAEFGTPVHASELRFLHGLQRVVAVDNGLLREAPRVLSSDEIEDRLESWILANREKLVGTTDAAGPSFLPRLQIYSSRATVSPTLLLAERATPRTGESPWGTLRRVLREGYGGADLVPMVAPDDQTVWAIVEELERRGVDLCDRKGRGHVALVGELDTFYGRALPPVFEAAIEACRAQGAFDSLAPTIQARLQGLPAPDRIHRFNYLRGLDGSLPSNRRESTVEDRLGDEPGQGRSASSAAGDEAPRIFRRPSASAWAGASRRGLERSAGPRRFDYMRRVALQLSELEMHLERDGERLQAIGVVGSDVYDTLLVLQALRRRFPQALFFTTDLDARLFHPDDYRWNRNLIVASSFGLRLSDEFQCSAPPFRDSYQTATFLATQAAVTLLGHPAPTSDARRARLRRAVAKLTSGDARCFVSRGARKGGADAPPPTCPPGPRLFEVARSGPYDITPGEEEDPVIHTERRRGSPYARTVTRAMVASVLGFCLVIPIFPRVRSYALGRWTCRAPSARRHVLTTDLFLLIALTTGLLLALAIHRNWITGLGEPFEMWEGISIWPTEMLRLAAAVLSLVLIARATVVLNENTAALSERYGLLPQHPGRPKPTFWDGWWQERRARRQARKSPEGTARTKAEETLTHRNILRRAWRGLRHEISLWWAKRREVSINEWDDHRPKVSAQVIWLRYVHLGRLSHRLTRLLPVAALYAGLGFTLVQLFGEPHKPLRGDLAARADKFVLFASVYSIIALTFFVVDASRLCERFIDRLGSCSTRWLGRSLQAIHERRALVVKEDAEDYLDAELIAERTRVVGQLILYPFIVLGIMLVSRIGFFDHWDWPVSLILIFGIMSTYALACAVVLRRAAERARRRILERLDEKLSQALVDSPRPGETTEEAQRRRELREVRSGQIRLLIEDVKNLRTGAFAPWSHHPIIKAILIPFGGVSAVVLLDLLASAGL